MGWQCGRGHPLRRRVRGLSHRHRFGKRGYQPRGHHWRAQASIRSLRRAAPICAIRPAPMWTAMVFRWLWEWRRKSRAAATSCWPGQLPRHVHAVHEHERLQRHGRTRCQIRPRRYHAFDDGYFPTRLGRQAAGTGGESVAAVAVLINLTAKNAKAFTEKTGEGFVL